MPSNDRNFALPDMIAKPLGIGTYTTKDGQTITYNDLPPEVQAQVDELSPERNSSDALSSMGVTNSWATGNDPADDLKQRQAIINQLYEPSTRDALMSKLTGQRIVRELGDRMSARDVGQR